MSSLPVSTSSSENTLQPLRSEHPLDALLTGVNRGYIEHEKAVGEVYRYFDTSSFSTFNEQAKQIALLQQSDQTADEAERVLNHLLESARGNPPKQIVRDLNCILWRGPTQNSL